jgi:hypothetical protein
MREQRPEHLFRQSAGDDVNNSTLSGRRFCSIFILEVADLLNQTCYYI